MNVLAPSTSASAVVPPKEGVRRARLHPAVGVIGGSNYFRTSEVRPRLSSCRGYIEVLDGWGERRYWGTPYVHADLSWIASDLLRIDLRWGHKHGWGRPSYYFRFHEFNCTWDQLTARSSAVKTALAGP